MNEKYSPFEYTDVNFMKRMFSENIVQKKCFDKIKKSMRSSLSISLACSGITLIFPIIFAFFFHNKTYNRLLIDYLFNAIIPFVLGVNIINLIKELYSYKKMVDKIKKGKIYGFNFNQKLMIEEIHYENNYSKNEVSEYFNEIKNTYGVSESYIDEVIKMTKLTNGENIYSRNFLKNFDEKIKHS